MYGITLQEFPVLQAYNDLTRGRLDQAPQRSRMCAHVQICVAQANLPSTTTNSSSEPGTETFHALLRDAIQRRQNGTYDDDAPPVMETCASMAMAYHKADSSFWTDAKDDGPWSLLEQDDNQIMTFVHLLVSILQRRDTKLFAEAKTKGSAKPATRMDPSSATTNSSSDPEITASRTPYKRRKKEVRASKQSCSDRTSECASTRRALSRDAEVSRSLQCDQTQSLVLLHSPPTASRQHQIDSDGRAPEFDNTGTVAFGILYTQSALYSSAPSSYL
ncbi:hypothetical protein LTR17_016663 [Elasticomyces elasticus]|nr:hypothetical protein LTR17_016663 [Elasticomyces elasticus]